MSMTSLSAQLLTVAIVALQRQLYHNRGIVNRTSWDSEYDYVVVGGGSAGCLVAGRLSENPNIRVLLLEAGGPSTVISDMLPMMWWFQTDWGYSTTPQANGAFALRNRQIGQIRGKILGGTNSVNYAAYSRGNRNDYDAWATTYGAGQGWSYQEVLPYFLRTENNTDPAIVAANSRFHSTSGPVQISSGPNPDPIIGRWLGAAWAQGWPHSDFANLEAQFGATIVQQQLAPNNWTRQTTAAAFIEPNIGRPNLHVLVNAHVTRILFNSTTSSMNITASGVEFLWQNTSIYQVFARREVILSAGSINSPQLLMLSGIGPRDHLQSFGIPVLANLPVGDHLADHAMILMDFTAQNVSDIGWSGSLYYNLNVENLYNYYTRATGPLTRILLPEVYFATGINGNRDWPDTASYMLIVQYSPSVSTFTPLVQPALADSFATYWRQWEDDNRHFIISLALFRPRSTGSIRLASSNPFTAPLIDPAYFSNRVDLAAVVAGMSQSMALAESIPQYMRYSALPVPGCSFCNDGQPVSRCLSYLACVAQQLTYTSWHPVGSVRMGNASSTDAVLDERLRVLGGVQRLRVIDASIMPQLVNSNPNAATMMIAERGVQMLREDNGHS